ncbi:MAG: 1-aminocyclopropane-1-carboxylate deaminase/D-cysteine desulfhydrase [bacterium]
MADVPGVPRVPLAVTPTPLRPAPRLSEELGAEIWFKRDDLLGLGLGGNKARPLEFLMGDALAQGCDVLVTGSGSQSNWSLLASLAARRCGLEAVVCLYGDPPPEARGNLALHRLVGSRLVWTGDPSRESVDLRIAEIAAELESAGRHPYVVPRGGATPLGSLGYLLGSREIAEQCAAAGIADPTVWLATGSCGTQAGLVAGVGGGILPRVIGVTVSRPVDECRERVLRLAVGAADLAGIAPPAHGNVEVVDGYLGPGYGYASPEGAAAAELALRTEGVFLDPPFCAKAMAALVDAAREGALTGPTVFLVSGGAPTLFVQDGPL